jgi:hypothetical protein
VNAPRTTPDPARQAERTVLAHWRTELSAVAVTGLIARQAEAGAERLTVVVVGGLALVGLVWIGWLRQRRLTEPDPPAAPRAIGLTVSALLVLQVLALVVVL